MDNKEMVEVSKDYLDQLEKDSELLSCLEACGVDNWGGWDDALEMMESEEDEE